MTSQSSNEDDRTILQDLTQLEPSSLTADIDTTTNKHALPIGTILEEFEIIDIIGWGGFGIVYLANDLALHRTVALKEYMPWSLAKRDTGKTVIVQSEKHKNTFDAGLKSFINEARLLAHFDHPSLIKVFRFWKSNGTAYMAMPFYKGETLKEKLLGMQNPPREDWLLFLLDHLLDALNDLHEDHCFHRDISPDNILILTGDKPLLLDFGAARHVINDMTHSLTVILKPGFAPIEQYGEIATMRQGPWTDLYALAAVIYFAITGKTPVPSVSRIVADSLVPLKELVSNNYSPHFLAAIDSALAVRPEERPQSVNEWRSLLGLGEKLSSKFDKSELSTEKAEKKQQSKTVYTIIGLILFAAIGTGIYQVSKQDLETIKTIPDQERKYTPITALDEIFDKRNKNHAVTVSVEKSKVRIEKDPLQFKIHSARAGYVYILMVGSNQTDFFLLFPNAVDTNNKIERGGQLNLPRPDWKIMATGPAGINHFIVIVSDRPRDFSSAGLVYVDPFAKFPFNEAQQLYRNYKGSSPLFAGNVICPSEYTDACSESYGAAVFSIEEIP